MYHLFVFSNLKFTPSLIRGLKLGALHVACVLPVIKGPKLIFLEWHFSNHMTITLTFNNI
jgi:hypothetical protein